MRQWPQKTSTSTVGLRGKFLWKFFIAPTSNYLCGMFLSPQHTLINVPVRIVSLVPSITALLHTLELEEETIGITKFCIHPNEWYRNKIRVGGTKNVDIQKVASLKPDLIIANREENVQDQIESLATDFPVLLTDVNNLAQALDMIETVGKITKRTPLASIVYKGIKDSFRQLALTRQNNTPLEAAYLIWKNPYMSVGSDTFIRDMMIQAGFNNVFDHQTRYPEVTIRDIQQSNCKVLLLSSEPYPFKQADIDEWKAQLPDVQVLLVNGEMFSWYGSLLLEAPLYFAQLMDEIHLYPKNM